MLSVPFRAAAARAFSLVELLVVLALIALLVSLLLPALGKSRAAARAAACLANQHTIGLGVTLYLNRSREYFPLSSHTAASLVAPGAWLTTLQDDGVSPRSRLCPEDQARALKLTSYATNDHLEPLTPGIDFNPLTGRTLPGGRKRALNRAGLIPRPSATVYAAEPAGEGTVDHLHSIGWSQPSQVEAALAVRRHSGSCNFLYCDGHAASVPWSRLAATFSAQTSIFNPETAR